MLIISWMGLPEGWSGPRVRAGSKAPKGPTFAIPFYLMTHLRRIVRSALGLLCSLLAFEALGQSTDASVQAHVTLQYSPPRITLNWVGHYNITGYQIYRKLKGGTDWGSAVASPAASSTSWSDQNVALNVSYEYKLVRNTTNLGQGVGYVNAGLQLDMVEHRGTLLLVVDNTFTTSLSGKLAQLQTDIEADGWKVERIDVSRSAAPTSVRTLIRNAYYADPANVKAAFLVGHVPVPYSGNIAPDGHPDHRGAWPADGYYADIDGNWTDQSVNTSSAQDHRNRNVPGDGKFDQNDLPSAAELMVGRVDFHNMPAFQANETTLLSNYLDKLHQWKVKEWTAQARGLIDDNFQGINLAFAANGLRNFGPLVGPSNVAALDYIGTMQSQSYLWSYGCGGGWWTGANGIGTTDELATKNLQGVFTLLFGSYFGDWDVQNSFLRATIAQGRTLCTGFAGIPNWYVHHMGLGETIGYGVKLVMNNRNGHYSPVNYSSGDVHIGLLGDPTLRMTMVRPPANLAVTNSGNNANLSWSASNDGVLGYHVYRFNSANGTWVRRTTTAVTGTSWSDNIQGLSGTIRYMVRAIKLETTPSGSYHNLSLGITGQTTTGQQTTDCLGVVGGTAVPGSGCNDNNPCTVNDTWNSSCQCVGTIQDNDGDGICNAQDNCPNTAGQIGSSCNDNNPCTTNDVLNSSCQCVGTFQDSDGDGTCDAQDSCPGTPGQVGSACNDNDPCTINDVLNANCQCAGTYADSDGDGACDAQDSCPNAAGQVGSACDDGNSCTTGDVLNAACQCAGVPVADADGDGICDAQDNCPNTAGQIGSACDDGDPCTTNDTVGADCQCTGLPSGDQDGDGACDAQDSCPTVPGQVGTSCDDGDPCTANDRLTADCNCAGTPMPDGDGDGICDVQDDCPLAPGQVGSACDDGDPCTFGDTLAADCACVGTPSADGDGDGICDAQDDCPGMAGQIGSPCDDGDPCTTGDLVNVNCGCAGEAMPDTDGDGLCDGVDVCPLLAGEVGSPCDDGQACTDGDTVTADCQCVGVPVADEDDDGICDAEDLCPGVAGSVGSTCDDGDPCTVGDVIGADCACAGTFQDSDGDGVCDALDGCPQLAGGVGDTCDDGDPATGEDTIGADCVCAGDPIDCLGVLNGPAMPGTPCDDGDPDTGDDRYTADCGCAGQELDCLGVPGGTAQLDACGVCNGTNDCLAGAITICQSVAPVGDVEEAEDGSIHYNAGAIDLVDDSSPTGWRGSQAVALRFNTLDVPRAAHVVAAHVQFTSNGTSNNGAASLSVAAELTSGSTVVENVDHAVTDRLYTDTLGWEPAPWPLANVAGGAQRTPDLSAIVQPVVSLATWEAGSPFLLKFEGAGDRSVWSADQSSIRAARFCVSYMPDQIVPYDCAGVLGGPAMPGMPCDDGDEATGGEVWSADCTCIGQAIDCAGVPGGSAWPGTPCDDGNGATGGDVWTADCQCAGQPIDCLGAVGGGALPGTPCDDGNGATGGDVWTVDCQCTGQPIDCLGVVGGDALPGTPCNDGNGATGGDVWTVDCQCTGQLIDCVGVVGGDALPGTPCDDGDASTGADAWSEDCTCAGLPLDCAGVPGGTAVIDLCGVCGGNNDCIAGEVCVSVGGTTDPDVEEAENGAIFPNIGGLDLIHDSSPTQWRGRQVIGLRFPAVAVPQGSTIVSAHVQFTALSSSTDTAELVITGQQAPDAPGFGTGSMDISLRPRTVEVAWEPAPWNAADGAGPAQRTPDITPVVQALVTQAGWSTGNAMVLIIEGTGGRTAWSWNMDPQRAARLCITYSTVNSPVMDCQGVVEGAAMPGTPCDDGDPATGDDVWTSACECAGEPLDCLAVPGGEALPGTPCDDGDFSTGNDTWTSACTCQGQPYDCNAVPGGPAMPGTPCDDGDPLTTGDRWTTACECMGLVPDCAGVLGGGAAIDGCGVCAGGTTGIAPDPDSDADGVLDCEDNCPDHFNPDQADEDVNGVGDACTFTGVEEGAGPGSFLLVPNPATDMVRIEGIVDPSVTMIELVDLRGATVVRSSFDPVLDVSRLAPGTYFFMLRDGQGRIRGQARFMKN